MVDLSYSGSDLFVSFTLKTDASKTATLEASAKPEPAPAVKEEETKAEKKPSTFGSIFKPKVRAWPSGECLFKQLQVTLIVLRVLFI